MSRARKNPGSSGTRGFGFSEYRVYRLCYSSSFYDRPRPLARLHSITYAHKFNDCLLPRIAKANSRQPNNTSVTTIPVREAFRQIVEENIHGIGIAKL